MNNESDPLWLLKINVDVIVCITAWLDPLSILQLSCTCKIFHAAISDDRFIWRRALHEVIDEYCVAPHSFGEMSTSDLKRFSTRPGRLSDSLRISSRPLQARTTEYDLDYSSIIPPRVDSSDTASLGKCVHLGSRLLPGGRWIISFISNFEEKATYLGQIMSLLHARYMAGDRLAYPQHATLFSLLGPRDLMFQSSSMPLS
ncbi:hypothetical protein DL93DRAFT_376982 [Clavulina sp. PMI_390]|nr:hypothetical protein DL93DRAFT_376982 [Clavulina sp. PMI_390]